MSKQLPDPIERGESRAEAWADENVAGDNFKCFCGNICKLSYAESISPDPYGSPACPECYRKAVNEANSQTP